MRVLELPTCPACGSAEFRAFDLGAGNHLRRCAACATVSAFDFVAPEDIYVDGYMFGEAGAFGLDVRAPEFQAYLRRVAHRRLELIEEPPAGAPAHCSTSVRAPVRCCSVHASEVGGCRGWSPSALPRRWRVIAAFR
jgi:hypothetical protein